MANGYHERGEIYKVRMDYGVGVEEGAFRPGLIISSDKINNTSGMVIVAYISRRANNRTRNTYDVEIDATGISSYVLCNQIAGVDKSRLMGYMGKLNPQEQKDVDDALESVIDLGYVDDSALKEKDREIEARDAVITEKDAEIAALKAQLEANMIAQQSRDDGYRIEIAMWQRLYEKALNQVVDMKYTNDLFLKNHLGREETKAVIPAPATVVTPEPPKQPEPPAEDTPVVEERLDINSCTITALKKLGFSVSLAKTIVDRRPYKTVADLKAVPGLKGTQYRIMEPKLCCTPVVAAVVEKPKPVSALVEPDTGCEEEETPAAAEVAKVNVNTASAQEISDATGMALCACWAITGKRKRDGLFKSLDELVIPGRISQKMLAKHRDKLTV